MLSTICGRGERPRSQGHIRATRTRVATQVLIGLVWTTLAAYGQDSLTHYAATCDVTFQGVTYGGLPCRSDDGGRPPGVYNLWTVTILADLPVLNAYLYTWVHQDLQDNGSLHQTALLWGGFTLTPVSRIMRDNMHLGYTYLTLAKIATFETRPQRLTVNREAGMVVLTFEETTQDSDGLLPTQLWLDKFIMDLKSYGGSKKLAQ